MVVNIADRGRPFEQDVPSITREHRRRSPRNIRRQPYGSASGHSDRENPGVVQEPAPYAIGDRFPVRRKARSSSAPNQKRLLPTQRGYHVDAASFPGRLESDQTTVGRKVRVEIVAIVGCDPDGLSSLGERLDPDIEILLSCPVGSIGHEPAIGRECREDGEAGIGGKLPGGGGGKL